MPFAFQPTDDGTIEAKATGHVTYAECKQLVADILAHPGLLPGANVLVDAREVTGVPDTSELRLIAEDMRPLAERGVAGWMILTRGGFVYGIAKMFKAIAAISGIRVGVFRTREEGREWFVA